MRRLPFAAILLVLLLLAPAIAGAFGVEQPLIENRDKVDYPDLNRGTLRQQHTFDQIDTALRDRLPLRGDAIDANARIDVEVFGDSPTPRVLLGRDGWLYFADELLPCTSEPPSADLADAAEIVARTLVASGRRAAVTVPAAKLTLQPEHAPEVDARARACVAALDREVDARLATTPGGLALGEDFAALRARGVDVFLPGDTHWASAAREIYARRVLEAIRPGLADATGLRRGPEIDRPADLWMLMGIGRTERDRALTADGPPARPPRGVLLIGDSQLGLALAFPRFAGLGPLMPHVLPDATFCRSDDFAAGLCDEQLAAASSVVLETVGRRAQFFTNSCARLVAVAARRIEGGRPVRLAPGPDPPTIPAGGAITAQTAGIAPTSSPRLLIVPVRTGEVGVTPTPRDGAPIPCVSPVARAGELVVIPVPAGRRAEDLVVALSSAGGATLGRAREIVLDAER